MKVSLIYISLILVNSLFAQTRLTISQIDTAWWYANYSNGLKYLDNNDLEAAEIEFRKILETDDNIGHAYYGFGRIYDKIEKDSDKAIEYLEKAIEINPGLIDAYYYLGIMFENRESGSSSKDCFEAVIEKNPHHIDAWIALARVDDKFKKWYELPSSSESMEILTEALEINPNEKKLYVKYRYYLFWHSFEELSIPTFKFLIEQNPSSSEYAIDFAQALYNLEMYQSCLKLLDSTEISYSNYSSLKINLLRAKTLFNIDDEDKGLIHYWKAINAIQDSADVNDFFSDLFYIMNNSEYEDYQSTSITDLPEFYSRFWLSRDPNLATKINERIAEHYKRLKVARKYYRRFKPGYYNKVVIYKFDHPLWGIMNMNIGDELINNFVSKALPEKKDLDDRGLIYLRHGEPDNFAFNNCMACPQNISWQYYARHNRPELIFHFRKYSDIRGWFLESLPYSFSNRSDFGGLYAQIDPSISLSLDISEKLWMYEELNNENIENVKVGLKTETTEYEYKNPLFNFPFKILFFKDEKSKTKVDLFYVIEGAHLQLNISKQSNYLSFATFTVFFDEKWKEIIRYTNDNYVPLNVDQDEWESASIANMDKFSILPGEYNFEFQLQDKISDNLGVYQGSLTIPNYWKNELMLSDIILSGPVSRKDEPSRFKKGDITFSPHMFTAYEERETVGLYIEIYNLLYDYTDRTNFEVTWLLKEEGTDETEAEVVKSSLQYSGETRDDKIYFNLDLLDTDSDDYELVILVKDMISEVEVSKKVKLTIQ